MDKLSDALGMDPMALRAVNALEDGDLTATQVKATVSNMGRLRPCLDKLGPLIRWEEGTRVEEPGGLIRVEAARLEALLPLAEELRGEGVDVVDTVLDVAQPDGLAALAQQHASLRLRYELARQFAPYVGVAWRGAAGETARLRRSRGEETQETRLLLGVRA